MNPAEGFRRSRRRDIDRMARLIEQACLLDGAHPERVVPGREKLRYLDAARRWTEHASDVAVIRCAPAPITGIIHAALYGVDDAEQSGEYEVLPADWARQVLDTMIRLRAPGAAVTG